MPNLDTGVFDENTPSHTHSFTNKIFTCAEPIIDAGKDWHSPYYLAKHNLSNTIKFLPASKVTVSACTDCTV